MVQDKPSTSLLLVTPAEDGLKLVQFLARRLDKDLPRTVLMRWIRTGQVRVDGRRAKPFDRLEQGRQVRLPPQALEQKRADAPAGETGDLEIVHEDGEVIVLNKPAGLPTQPGGRGGDSLATRLAARFAGADYMPAPAHRLDRDASGLVLAGKTHAAQRRLHELFSRQEGETMIKDYLAWVDGRWPHREPQLMEDRLSKNIQPDGRELMALDESGQTALATATLLEIRGETSLLLVRLHTGRKHQIRVQLASRGHPIIGDVKYGGPRLAGQRGMLLQAWRVEAPGMGRFESGPEWAGKYAVNAVVVEKGRSVESTGTRADRQ